MSIVFAVRGNSFDARYSSSGKSPVLIYPVGANIPTIEASGFANELFSSSIDLEKGSAVVSYLEFIGKNNTPTKGFSINLRVSFGQTTGLLGLWGFGSGTQGTYSRVLLYYNAATLNFRYYDSTLSLKLNVNSAWTPTINTFYDIFCIWDGTTGSNAGKIYVDGTLLAQATSTAERPVDSRSSISNISLGASSWDTQSTRSHINEFTIWDSAEDPTAVTLDSGSGALSGALRSSPVTTTLFDGSSYTDPGIANVQDSQSYTFAGVSLTGAVGSSVDPGESNVLLNTSYAINGTSLTGTLSIPTPASGTAGTVDLNNILEQIRFVVDASNTTTASPVDLSANMVNRVNHVAKIHPMLIPMQASFYPFVTCFISDKSIEHTSVGQNQISVKRRARVTINLVGAVWNDNMIDIKADPASKDCHYLMENLEYILRSYDNLNGNINWQLGQNVKYYEDMVSEDSHLRAGVLTLQASVFY